MRYLILTARSLIALLILHSSLFAQKQNNIWYFGDKAGLDFNTNPPTALSSNLFTLEGTASISDPTGHLLFYTNGTTIWDRQHNVMPNGSGLLGGESSTQAALIIPRPNSCQTYYVFMTEDQFTDGGLTYSTVDMCLNNGFGDVVPTEKNILLQNVTAEKITAVLHANGVDIWVITHKLGSNEFLAYLVTSAGINTTPIVSAIGANYPLDAFIGPAKASHDGTKIASSASFKNICDLFDFDRSTGKLSNRVNLMPLFPSQAFIYGIEFSPNDSLLYLSSFYVTSRLFQLDLESLQLTTLNSITGNYIYGGLQLGPDNKIYMARFDSSFVDVIHQPDVKGSSCQYEERGQLLAAGTKSQSGLPNFAPYSFFRDTTAYLSLPGDTSFCMGDSLVLELTTNANCPTEYLWNDGSAENVKVVKQTGLYWVDISSSCLHYRDSIQIDVNPAPTTSESVKICEGESYEGYSHSGTYIDHFVTAKGCDSTRTLTLTVESCSLECPETFAKVLGSSSGDEKGYALASSEAERVVYAAGTINDTLMIVRVLENGDIDWARKIELFKNKKVYINGMILDAEGKLGIAGTVGNLNDQGNVFVCRYDPAINQLLWSKEMISTSMGYTSGIFEMGPGGNYLLSNNPSTPNDAELVLLDKNTGDIQPAFSKHYNLDGPETIAEVVLYKGGLYAVGRFTDGPTFPDMRTSLMRMNPANGIPDYTLLGHKSANTTARIYGVDLVIDNDFIYYTSLGDMDGTSIDNTEIFVQKATLDGNIVWLKQYDLPVPNDWVDEIVKSGDGFVVLARNRVSPSDLFLFKIDIDGNVVWSSKFDYATNDNSVSLGGISSQMVTLGDFIYFAAYAEEAGQYDMILAKVSKDGQITDSCMIFTPITITAKEITNRTYYNVNMDVFDFVPQSIDQPHNIGIDIPLEMTNLCGGQSSVETNVEATICEGEEYEGYTQTGIYIDAFQTSTGCDSIRTLMLTVNPLKETTITKEICSGQAFEGYIHTGTYQDTFSLVSGCDSIRILHLTVFDCNPIVTYNLNDCRAYMSDGSLMDYSEFVPTYPNAISCGSLSATTLFRNPPQDNKHSCTPGVNSSVGMCISAITSCNYIAGHSSSLVAELSIQPQTDSIIRITKLEFYERSPNMYNWIDGGTGLNNYPRFYGLRVLKNGQEIFLIKDIATHLNWTLQSYDFSAIPEFTIDAPAVLRIELLPYCAIGNGAAVSAWDIDEVNIYGGCVVPPGDFSIISGIVKTSQDVPVPGVTMSIGENSLFSPSWETQTDVNGSYHFDTMEKGIAYYLQGRKNDDLLLGVNTFDLLAIQKHLLGIQPLTTLAQYVAADINHNDVVNVMDIVELKKVLLGINAAFPNNTSWRIGNCREMLSHNMDDFRETELIPSVIDEQVKMDVLGIKIGDVNEDITMGAQSNELESRADQRYMIGCKDQEFSIGEKIVVPVSAFSAIQLEGIQLMIESGDFVLTGIQAGKIPLTPDCYYINQQGELSISWSQAEPILISAADILFTLTFSTHSSGNLKDKLHLIHTVLQPEVYTLAETKSVVLSISRPAESESALQMTDISVDPNPFKNNTTIRFNLNRPGTVRFVFFNLSGQKLYDLQQEYLPGAQSLEIRNTMLPEGEAFIYCQLIAQDQVVTRKLVKMR